jgi:predicted ester cyclase
VSQQNKDLWREFVTAWDAGDLDALEGMSAPGVVDHSAMPGAPPGIEGMKTLNTMLKVAFPDRSTEVHTVIAEGDMVAAQHTIRGTNTGEFMGMPATGKPVEVGSLHIVRYTDGKLSEHWGLPDQGGMLMQLGVMPMPPGTESWRPPPIAPQVKAGTAGDPDANRKAMADMVAAMRDGKLDEVLAGVAENVVDHAAMPGQGPGKEGVGWRFEQLFAGLTNPNFQVEASVGEGPYLSQSYTFTATHSGAMMGMPPTNKSFQIQAIDFVLFEDGKMREHWGLIDFPGMMIQLGLMQPPG